MCDVIGIHYVKNEYELNWEHYTAFYTVFYVNDFRSMGQVGKMEFDEIGQRVIIPLNQILNLYHQIGVIKSIFEVFHRSPVNLFPIGI